MSNIEWRLFLSDIQWNKELERIGVKFMLCGHFHKAFILQPGNERSLIEHKYPVVVGSLLDKDLWGAAITLNKDKMLVQFTNKAREAVETYELDLS